MINATQPDPYLLSRVLRAPQSATELNLRQWEQLIWQARSAELIGQLEARLAATNLQQFAPAAAQRHLKIACDIARKHADAVRWELHMIQDCLKPLGIPVILLKGAAYCALSSPAALGRIFNDIDILVPKEALSSVEDALTGAGWLSAHTNAYDERYYREWMHEIPPMEHKNRCTVLDIHHTILAPTSGIRPDPQSLFNNSAHLNGEWEFFQVLSPQEMVAHSACHLFFGEFHRGLRDLFDLHQLITSFESDPGYIDSLLERAHGMGLLSPVVDAIRQSNRLFGTTFSKQSLQSCVSEVPSWPPASWRDWFFDRVLRPANPSANHSLGSFANWIAFARSHHLRMPWGLLAYHVSHKLFKVE
jgi:hypothetical protein